MPKHIHCIWTLPTGDSDFSTRWKKLKSGFSRGLPKTEERSKSRINKGERGIWQRRYWEHTLRNEKDFIRHVEYIHYNPVNYGYVNQVREWPNSSSHRFVNEGKYPLNWAGCSDNEIGCFGE